MNIRLNENRQACLAVVKDNYEDFNDLKSGCVFKHGEGKYLKCFDRVISLGNFITFLPADFKDRKVIPIGMLVID
jgi:hypothetical protein